MGDCLGFTLEHTELLLFKYRTYDNTMKTFEHGGQIEKFAYELGCES